MFGSQSRTRAYRGAVFPLFLSLALAALCGCASLSDARFFADAVEDRRKAEILAEKGVELYEGELLKAERLERIGEVRKYFETALRYDPDNSTAVRYVEKLDGFVRARVEGRVALAESLSKKPNRTEDESLQLCAAVTEVSRLDPENAALPRLRNDSKALCAGLVASYMDKARSLRDSVREDWRDERAERAYLQALDYCARVLLIDPRNAKARAEKKRLQDDLSPVFQRRREAVEQDIAEGRFEQAVRGLDALRALDAKLDGRFEKETRALSYSLHYNWAKRSLAQKRFQTATEQADKALAADRTPEALALKREIASQRRALEEGADFQAFLAYIDSLIDQKRLGEANRHLARLLGRTEDPARTRQLEQRRSRLRSLLPELYREGVDAYKRESFPKAVQSLAVVVDVDPDYEQAASYLEKARSKQRLLESM